MRGRNEIKAKLLEYHYNTSNKDSRVGNYSGLKVQKFLFFYNAFSMIDEKPYTDNLLYAYEAGPIYYDVLSLSRNHPTTNVVSILESETPDMSDIVLDKVNLKTAFMLTELFPSDELSKITHNLEVWQQKYNKFKEDSEKSRFTFDDFTPNDIEYLQDLKTVFSPKLLENFNVEYGKNFSYLIEKRNYHYILEELGGIDNLKKIRGVYNPIYIYVEQGEIIID